MSPRRQNHPRRNFAWAERDQKNLWIGKTCVFKVREPLHKVQSFEQLRTRHSQESWGSGSESARPHPLRPGSGSSPPSHPGTASSGRSPAAPAPPRWRSRPRPWRSPPPTTSNTCHLNLTTSTGRRAASRRIKKINPKNGYRFGGTPGSFQSQHLPLSVTVMSPPCCPTLSLLLIFAKFTGLEQPSRTGTQLPICAFEAQAVSTCCHMHSWWRHRVSSNFKVLMTGPWANSFTSHYLNFLFSIMVSKSQGVWKD